jgi:hypothetical protein
MRTPCEGRRPWARTTRTWWTMRRRICGCGTRKNPSPAGQSFFFSSVEFIIEQVPGTYPTVKLEKLDRHCMQIKAERQMFSTTFWRCTVQHPTFFNILKCGEKKMDMDPDIQRNLALIFCYTQSFFFERTLNLRKIISAHCGKSQILILTEIFWQLTIHYCRFVPYLRFFYLLRFLNLLLSI